MESKKRAKNKAEPEQISEDTWWVGNRLKSEILHSNSYVRRFDGPGAQGEPFILFIDPASDKDLAVMEPMIDELIGGLRQVSALWLNHQDPGISKAVATLLEAHIPQAPVLCSEDTAELLHNYCDISGGQIVPLEDYEKNMRLPTGDVVTPVAVPFCHFMGATMLYDPTNRVLFSGDLFAGLTQPGYEELFADESDWAGVRAFHQIYMPTQQAVRNAIEAIRQLEPPVEVIAPQHGKIIEGEWIDLFMDRLYNLPVGVDVLAEDNDADNAGQWTAVLAGLVEQAEARLGAGEARQILAHDDRLGQQLHIAQNTLAVTGDGRQVVERAVRLWADELARGEANSLRFEALTAAARRNLPTPGVDLGEQSFRPRDGANPLEVSPHFRAV